MPFNVVVMDDYPLIHEAIADQFSRSSEEFLLVGKGTAGEEIEPLVEGYWPDVVLLDVSLPVRRGTTLRQARRYQALPAIKRLHETYPQTKIVILSSDAKRALVHAPVEYGAQADLIKGNDLSLHLPDAIRALMKGGRVFLE